MMGIINLFKPPGMTSFDCVKEVRKITGVKKVGHTGTLDPLACGVLPICLGRATRIVPFILEREKVYRGELFLGLTTTTLDLEGEILSTSNREVKVDEILDVFSSFEGRQMQLPPLYSARRVGGRRYYQLVREGKEVNRKPTEVTVYELKYLVRNGPRVLFETRVSKGTYVRSLVRDIGERLGCGACLSLLIRSEAGPFTIERTKTLEEVEKAYRMNQEDKVLLPPGCGLKDLPAVHIREGALKKVKNGAPLGQGDILSYPKASPGALVQIYEKERFLAIYQCEESTLFAKRVFL